MRFLKFKLPHRKVFKKVSHYYLSAVIFLCLVFANHSSQMVELQAPTGLTASLFCHDAEVPYVTQGTKSLTTKSQRFYRKNIVILLNLASCAALADDFKVALFNSFAVISDFKTQEP